MRKEKKHPRTPGLKTTKVKKLPQQKALEAPAAKNCGFEGN